MGDFARVPEVQQIRERLADCEHLALEIDGLRDFDAARFLACLETAASMLDLRLGPWEAACNDEGRKPNDEGNPKPEARSPKPEG